MTSTPTGPAAAGRETPDIATSSAAYARRFAGPLGAWFLEVQTEATLGFLSRYPRASILDVGGGHAQLAPALVRAGHAVTVYGSDPVCAELLRAQLAAGHARFVAGDLLRAPWPDGAFDVVLAFRLLPHVTRWRALVAELSRLACRAIVVDYPTRRSLNAVADVLFAVKKGIERDTRPFTVFKDDELRRVFIACGFQPSGRHPQFFWPMAMHRALASPRISRGLERAAAALGLRRFLGSPVILALSREEGPPPFPRPRGLSGCGCPPSAGR